MKTHPPAEPDEGPVAGPVADLDVYPLDDGRWAWRYLEPATRIELNSNEAYATHDEAEEAARRAYPDVPLPEDEVDA